MIRRVKLTTIASTDRRATASIRVGDRSHEKVDNNERRRQRRLFIVLNCETVAIVFPRLFALLFHRVIFVATITESELRIIQYSLFSSINMLNCMQTNLTHPYLGQVHHGTIHDRLRFVRNRTLYHAYKTCLKVYYYRIIQPSLLNY